MKRRNFLSGLLTAPLALKARFFARKRCTELCGAPVFRGLVFHDHSARQRPVNRSTSTRQVISPSTDQVIQLLAEGKSIKELGALKVAPRKAGFHPTYSCSLPRGRKGPQLLLNPR